MTDTHLTTLASPHGFATTLARLEGVLDARRLTIFARIDHAAGARAAGLTLRPTVVLLFGDAGGGTPLMQALPMAALDLPLHILVFEDETGVARLVWRDPRATVDDAPAPVAARLSELLSVVAEAAIGDAPLALPLAGAAVVHDKAPGVVQAQVSTGGQSFYADEPTDHGGGGAGPSPHDLLAAGLAACTTMTLRLYADRKEWPLERVHVAVDHVRELEATPPDLFRRRVALAGPLDADQRQRLMQIADRCPVHRTLTAGARVETEDRTEQGAAIQSRLA